MSDPIVTFNALVPQRLPEPASASLNGTLPQRAHYCEVLTSANAHGWYVFPPIRFALMSPDGISLAWSPGGDTWYRLGTAHYPNFSEQFAAAAPAHLQDRVMPWLSQTVTGMAQIWTGLTVRTASDWSIKATAPVNIVSPRAMHHLEGIIEADRWGGPLFFNVRLLESNVPVWFEPDKPYLQLQPLPRIAYSRETTASMKIEDGLMSMTSTDWSEYERITNPRSRLGDYARDVRKRRAAETSGNP